MQSNHNHVNGKDCSKCERCRAESPSRGPSSDDFSGISHGTSLLRPNHWQRYLPHQHHHHHHHQQQLHPLIHYHQPPKVLYVEVIKARGAALGLTLRLSKSGRCIVGRIIHGGLVYKTGLLHVCDEILEINGNPVNAHSIEEVQQYIMFVRAMFNYNSMEDPDLPCREIGQSFKIGDILEILDATDFSWWQARLRTAGLKPDNSSSSSAQALSQENSLNPNELRSPARLIPSSDLQESRVAMATHEAQEALLSGPLDHGSSLLGLLMPPRWGEDRSIASTSSGVGAKSTLPSATAQALQATLSRWIPFQRMSERYRGRSRAVRQPPNSATSREKLSRALSSPAPHSRRYLDSLDFTFDADEEEAGIESTLAFSQNGIDHSGSTAGSIPNQKCARCSSTVLTRSSASSVRWRNWTECAPFLFSEVPFQPYEEVVPVSGFRQRSLLILGARGVGRRTLRKALVRARPDLFGAVVPHTTRKPEPHEKNGVHYFFVEQEEMASDIVSKEFLEYGQHKNVIFGIRLDSVRAVIASGRIPVLDVEPKALRILRSVEFAPIVILIAPPCLSLLIRDSHHDMLNSSLTKLTRESKILENVYWPYIDKVIVHHDVDDSVQEIIDHVVRLETTEQWVPITWIY